MKSTAIETFGVTITEDDVRQFFAQFSGDSRCPTCHNDDWVLTLGPPDEPSQVLAMRTYGPTGLAGTSHVPVFLSVCDICGYVNTYSTQQIAAWKKDLTGGTDE